MSDSKKTVPAIRCPWCFSRDVDVQLFYSKTDNLFYCWRCCYTADSYETVCADLSQLRSHRYRKYYKSEDEGQKNV